MRSGQTLEYSDAALGRDDHTEFQHTRTLRTANFVACSRSDSLLFWFTTLSMQFHAEWFEVVATVINGVVFGDTPQLAESVATVTPRLKL
jgi:hypothetical protein